SPSSGTAPEKHLWAWSPARLADACDDPLAPEDSGACWFATPEQAHLAHATLRDQPTAAFADDEQTLARLAVYTRTAFRGSPGPAAFEVARRFASNSSFFRKTRDQEKVARAAPTPLPMPGEEPLRVLLQLDTFGKGGLERVAGDLAACWLEQGCTIGLLALDDSADALPAGVERVTLRSRDDDGYARMLADGGWHVVSAHASTFGAAMAAAAGVPFVQVVHNSYVWFDRDQVEAYREADEHTAAYACVSAQALGYSDLRLHLDVHKMLVIENGIAAEGHVPADARQRVRNELGLADTDYVFLQVASLQPAKAHRVAVHALAALRREKPRARLVCLGSEMNPMHAAAIRGEVKALGLEDAVVFAGHREDAEHCYAMADAFFLPSFWEGCSLAVFEAMRAGLPMVLSDVGAARQQLHLYGGQGELVAPPFESMFALDASNLDATVHAIDPDYAERLAKAMANCIDKTAQPRPGLPRAAGRATMAARHLTLMRWLRQGGSVAAIRQTIARQARQTEPAPEPVALAH
ncbi:MAG: glycosyltransferase family 4 protein, partial [Planctomycetota bacterium]|nr:glycosyltransferase family 4 protein [Planctomycetota bacterium]